MLQAELLVFDDIIYAGATAYTSASFNDALAGHDLLAVMAVIDGVSTKNVGFDLFVEHSCDGRNWLQRSDPGQSFPAAHAPGTGDITFSATHTPLLGTNTTYARMYSDVAWGLTKIAFNGGASGGPLLGYVRLAMKLGAGLAHVKVYVVQRDVKPSAARRPARGARP